MSEDFFLIILDKDDKNDYNDKKGCIILTR